MSKEDRHSELALKLDDETLTSEESAELTQLYYELHPDVFREFVKDPNVQPSDIQWYSSHKGRNR